MQQGQQTIIAGNTHCSSYTAALQSNWIHSYRRSVWLCLLSSCLSARRTWNCREGQRDIRVQVKKGCESGRSGWEREKQVMKMSKTKRVRGAHTPVWHTHPLDKLYLVFHCQLIHRVCTRGEADDTDCQLLKPHYLTYGGWSNSRYEALVQTSFKQQQKQGRHMGLKFLQIVWIRCLWTVEFKSLKSYLKI